ncbi:hypothetical protein CBS101457_006684 [Exobasidium rhododendri]|nr:hypothetical protein CBS101457_006684 [Exobasidium rhododendri]
MGSSATGLRSSSAHFDPPYTPHHAQASSEEIKYTASGYMSATARKSEGVAGSSWETHRDMIESWWFGAGTKEVTQKFQFDWDNAPTKPESYNVNVEVNLAAFAEPDSGLSDVIVEGQGWRTRVQLSSIASKAGQE